MEAPAAEAAPSSQVVLCDLDEAVVQLRSDRQRLDVLLDDYGDLLGQMATSADARSPSLDRRCGVGTGAR